MEGKRGGERSKSQSDGSEGDAICNLTQSIKSTSELNAETRPAKGRNPCGAKLTQRFDSLSTRSASSSSVSASSILSVSSFCLMYFCFV